MEFQTWHIAAVCAVLVLVHCCHNVIACCRDCDSAIARLCGECCDIRGCPALLRRAVLLACFIQPFVLCFVLALRSASATSTTAIMDTTHLWCAMRAAVQGNTTEHTLVDAQCVGRTFEDNESVLYHVDVLFFVMPFTISASISTLSWTHLSHDNVLHESLQWDEHLDASCVWYELSYCCELFFAAIAFTGFLADGSTAVELYFVVLTVGGSLTLVTASARFARAAETEAVFALIFALLCALVFGAVFGNVVRVSCVLCMLVALAFALHVTIITTVHITARGERLASTIIAVRTLTSLVSGYVLIAAYAVGKDKVCGGEALHKQVIS